MMKEDTPLFKDFTEYHQENHVHFVLHQVHERIF